MSSNPYQGPSEGDESPSAGDTWKPTSNQDAYNVVTDVVTGPNLRWKDNLFQAVAIMVSMAVGALVGYFVADDKPIGVFAGGGAGLLVGLFGSGTFLMVWRGLRHLRGKHN